MGSKTCLKCLRLKNKTVLRILRPKSLSRLNFRHFFGTCGGFFCLITLDKDSFGAMSQVKSFSAQTELMLQITAAKKPPQNPFLCPPLPEITDILFWKKQSKSRVNPLNVCVILQSQALSIVCTAAVSKHIQRALKGTESTKVSFHVCQSACGSSAL